MRHLIVEACIARNLLDTSAYFWPGYVKCSNQLSRNVPSQVTGWASLMKGSPLTPALVNALISTPASRYAPFVLVITKIFMVSLREMRVGGEGQEEKLCWWWCLLIYLLIQ